MPKPTRPDRKGKGRERRNEPKEFAESTLSIDRVTRVVKGGRRMRFRAVVVVGDRKGKVGLGTGKSGEVQGAVQKATRDAKRNMVRIPLRQSTIPHEVNIKHKSARLRILPAAPGTGIIAGGAARVILDLAGVKDVLSKRFGTKNKLVNAQATIEALKRLKGKYRDPKAEAAAPAADDAKEQLAVKEVTRKEVEDMSTKGSVGGEI